jgi:hypothetical protein
MGYVTASGPCVSCGRLFTYNPIRVPSTRIAGFAEPLCLTCVERANVIRAENGLAPIVPAPDAYTGCDEAELP